MKVKLDIFSILSLFSVLLKFRIQLKSTWISSWMRDKKMVKYQIFCVFIPFDIRNFKALAKKIVYGLFLFEFFFTIVCLKNLFLHSFRDYVALKAAYLFFVRDETQINGKMNFLLSIRLTSFNWIHLPYALYNIVHIYRALGCRALWVPWQSVY